MEHELPIAPTSADLTPDPPANSLRPLRGRRWSKWLLIAAGTLITIYISWVAFGVYRPLNETEFKLVGEWVPDKVGAKSPVLVLKGDRTFTVLVDLRGMEEISERKVVRSGTWAVHGSRLKMRTDSGPFRSISAFKRTVVEYLFPQDATIESITAREFIANKEKFLRNPIEGERIKLP